MTLLGHEEAWRQWRDASQGTRMHHAWLLAGRKGVGKAGFALAAARELVGADPAMEHHPDIIVLTHGPKDEKEERKRAEGKPFELARTHQRQRQVRDGTADDVEQAAIETQGVLPRDGPGLPAISGTGS